MSYIDDDLRESKTYKDILEHRRKCNKWGKEFCLECFGGGLNLFFGKLIYELDSLSVSNKSEVKE